MTAQSWHAIPLLIGLATSFGCSHPVAAPIAVLPEDPPDNEEIAPIREPSIRLGSRKFRHQLVGQALVFSPDGKTLYSGGSDGTVKAWDVETGDCAAIVRGP